MTLVPDVDGEDVRDGLLERGVGRGWFGAEVEDGVSWRRRSLRRTAMRMLRVIVDGLPWNEDLSTEKEEREREREKEWKR